MKIKKLLILFFSSYLCLLGCQPSSSNPGVEVQVQRVVSGQTIEIMLPSSRFVEQVRLVGIQAPDLRQKPWGRKAQEKLAELLKNKDTGNFTQVFLEEAAANDSYGRRLGYVWHNKKLVNEQLVAEGYVLADLEFSHKYSQRLGNAQTYARLMGYGVWDTKNPLRLTPQEFRSQNKP